MSTSYSPRPDLPPCKLPLLTFVLLALGLVTTAPAVHAAGERLVLGSDGEPVRLLQDTYGDLFPVGSETDPRHPVLALERRGPGGAMIRTLVPGTAGAEEEVEFSLLYDKTFDSLVVFWESRREDTAALHLVCIDAQGNESDPFEISEDPFSWKSAPRLAITRDSLPPEADSEKEADHRSVLHLVWAEERPDGDRILFAPVVLRNGAYAGSHPVLDLSDLLVAESTAEALEPAASLVEAPTLRAGEDDRSVIVAFTDRKTRRLVTLEVETLPAQLAALAGDARANITVFGSHSKVQSVADVARANITVFGRRLRFHPAVVTYMADRTYEAILAAGAKPGAPDLEYLAQVAWLEIVRAATGFEDRGLMDSEEGPGTPIPRILELGGPEAVGGSSPPQLLQIRQVSSWPVPVTPEAPIRVSVSASGKDVIVSWPVEGRIEYRESRDSGWSEVQHLDLGGNLSLVGAYELLEQRVSAGD